MPRRPFIAVPRYIRRQSSPMSNGSAPISISLMHRPIVWVPGASMQALAIHGLTSHLADARHAAVGADDDDEAVLRGGGEARVVVGREQDVALDRVDPHTGSAFTSF